MRFTRPAAVLATAALVAASTALIAAPAYAEETVGDVTFYGAADFGQESSGYPAGVDWFFGDDSDGTGAGTATFTVNGLEINNGSGTDGIIQILNQNVTTPADAPAFVTWVETFSVYEDSAADPGAWSFQVPLFADGTSEFTTLRPSALGTADTSINWITSQAIIGAGSVGTPDYPAGSAAALSDLLSAIYNNGSPTLLGYGLWFSDAQSPVIHAISMGEDISAFTPVPERSIAPGAEVTSAETESGITVSGSGWLPGSDTYFSVWPCVDGDTDAEPTDEMMDEFETHVLTVIGEDLYADAGGNVSVTFSFEPGLEPGFYCYVFDDDAFLWSNGVLPALSFEVLPEELAATGADPMNGMLAAAGFLGLGALALTLVMVRRRHVAA